MSTRFVGENVIEFYPFRQRFPSIYPPTRMRLDSANKLGFKNGYKLIFLYASIIKLTASQVFVERGAPTRRRRFCALACKRSFCASAEFEQ